MGIHLILLLIALFALPVTSGWAGDAHVALIKGVTGKVDVLRDAELLDAAPGMQLLRMDRIRTGEASTASIVFIDGTLITMGASTYIEVSEYLFEPKDARYDFMLYVKKGSAIYSSGRLGKLSPDSVNLKTPRATVGIRGTRFIVRVD